jgi:predicted AAA+ superfamily ATPase
MKRDLIQQLSEWSESPLRKPLILRGARQVGKSWLINEFGKGFDYFLKIDFDATPKAKSIFSSQDSLSYLITNLEIYAKQKIVPGKTLLFLDEIQECPEAINVLRLFKEDLPGLHVIAAGSLLDFILEKVGMPVGRVQFMYLYPLSFGEFLTATDQDDLRNHIMRSNISPAIHDHILEMLKTYMWLGGMPAVIDAWIKYKKFTLCQELQDEIIAAYSQDFYKYAKHRNIEFITKIFESIPMQLGKKFKFSNVDNEVRSVNLKAALMLLNTAGVAHLCYHSASHEQPLGATKDEKKFKTFLFDIGLAQRMLGLVLEDWQFKALQIKNLGGIAEQFIAQELIAYSSVKDKAELYYWHRESKSSNAEVDFVVIKNQQIVPIEVKAGATGHLRSMHSFLNEHKNSSYGLKISENAFSEHGNLVEIPLYGIEAWLKRK